MDACLDREHSNWPRCSLLKPNTPTHLEVEASRIIIATSMQYVLLDMILIHIVWSWQYIYVCVTNHTAFMFRTGLHIFIIYNPCKLMLDNFGGFLAYG